MTPPSPTKLSQATKTFVNNSGLLVLGTTIALVWANLDHASYVAFSHYLHFPVNEIGMTFFFALAAKEVVEATAPGGPLHSPRRAAMPLAAAVGGMFGPALIFVALTIVFDRPNLERGWAIPDGDRHRVQLPRRAHRLRRSGTRSSRFSFSSRLPTTRSDCSSLRRSIQRGQCG